MTKKIHRMMSVLTVFMAVMFIAIKTSHAATDKEQIRATLNNYIQGTSYNYPNKIARAFYPSAELLLEKKDTPLWRVPAQEYISWFKAGNAGKFTGRIGEILNIDVSGAIATAKVEILLPARKTRFVDLFLLKRIDGSWQIISKTAVKHSANNNGMRILFIVSNQQFHGSSKLPVGASFSELVNAYDTFKSAGYTIDFVSPDGGAIPLSYINTSDALQKRYLYDVDFMYGLANTLAPDEIKASQYKAVHYIGGSSAMYGVANNVKINKISMDIYEKYNGIISSVCHGTAGIAFLKLSSGEFLVKGKSISGYPDEYEDPKREYYQHFPFPITQTIEKHGGKFKYSARSKVHVESDGRVVTGQNYQSSALVAQSVIDIIAQQAKQKG